MIIMNKNDNSHSKKYYSKVAFHLNIMHGQTIGLQHLVVIT